MPHAGLVDEGQGCLLVLPDGQRRVVRVGAVDAPLVGGVGGGQVGHHLGVGLGERQLGFFGGREQVDRPDLSAQLRRPEIGRRRRPDAGREQRPAQGVLALRGSDQGEHAVAGGDDDVVALAHADQQCVDVGRYHRESVGVRDPHPVAAEGDPERGVRSGVDEPDSDALTGLGPECRRGLGDPAVHDVIGVDDVAGVAAEQGTATRLARLAHAAARPHRPHRPHGGHAALLQVVEDLLG